MKILSLQQGSPEWLAARARYFTASEAPVMMSASSKMRRNELLHIKATGSEKEISEWVQRNLFEKGHEIEAMARPIAEQVIGEELYPATAIDDHDYLLASFDGITLLEDTIWECKSWNAAKAEEVRAGRCPEEDIWQVIQQLAVSDAERCLYMVTDGTEEGTVHTWVEREAAQENQLLAGWAQFEKDLAEYVPEAPKAEPIGRAPDALPALHIEVEGAVTASNLAEFRDHALAVFSGINTDLQTDNDFADAERTVKWCKDVESRLEAAKDHALAQTATIDELFRTVDSIRDEARAKRLELDKLVKARKEQLREEIRRSAVEALRGHFDAINAEFAGRALLGVPADFGSEVAAVMKGKKTLASLRDAADSTLAAFKIEADRQAEQVRQNIKIIDQVHPDHARLLPDAAQLVVAKHADDLVAIIKARVADHEAAEEQRREAERERIRQEEQRKLEAQQRQEEQAQRQAETKTSAPTQAQATTTASPAKGARQEQPVADPLKYALRNWQGQHGISDDAMTALLDILADHAALPKAA